MRVSYVCIICVYHICVFRRMKARMTLDRADTSSSDSHARARARFTFFKVTESYADPGTKLFMESLNAELSAHPHLAKMDPKRADRLAPDPDAFSNGGRRYAHFTPVFFNTTMLCRGCLHKRCLH